MQVRSVAVILTVVALFVISFTVSGHKLLESTATGDRDNPVPVPDHQVSWAAYEELSEPGEVDYYKFTANRGEEIYSSIVIPKIDRLEDFDPSFALIGPGLISDTPAEGKLTEILDIREGESYISVPYEGQEDTVFFEPFTQTSYWERQELRINAPADGTYLVAVYHPTGEVGKYVLAIGEKEVFGPRDILNLPATWWKVRMFVERRFSTYVITGAVLGGLTIGGFFLARAIF